MGLRSGIAIDVGTVNTLVHVAGRGIVIDEPSAIAISQATGAVVAVGRNADALTDKEPQGVHVIHPLRGGVIADLEATVAMLQSFLKQARIHGWLRRTPAVVCLPVEITWIERRAVVVAAQALKPRCRVQLVDVPVAAAAGAGFDQAAGAGAFIVDVGGGTTQAAILAGGHIVRARSVRRAGNAMDDAIIRVIRKEHELLIGRSAARSLKMTLGLADEADAEAEVLGVDAARRVPRAERISGRLIAQAIAPTVAAITGVVEDMLSDLPPNLAAEIFRGKIRLAGGGALLPGLAYRLEAAADVPVVVVDDPIHCVVRGAAQILERGSLTK